MNTENKLVGRVARCTYNHGKEAASDEGLPFFEFNGEGSRSAELCKCGFAEVAHNKTPEAGRKPNRNICDTYRPRGDIGHDGYYCGCYGWG